VVEYDGNHIENSPRANLPGSTGIAPVVPPGGQSVTHELPRFSPDPHSDGYRRELAKRESRSSQNQRVAC